MRHLSFAEYRLFEDAFNCIMRVASIDADPVHIFANGEPLPVVYDELVQKVGGMEKLRHYFCPGNKSGTIDLLIKKCFRQRLQPSAFIFEGPLHHVRPRNVPTIELTYVMESEAS